MGKNIRDIKIRSAFQQRIGYQYLDEEKLIQALTHRSYVNELKVNTGIRHNERMEFLGDAVLELVVSDYLYQKYDEKAEGKLTKLRASLVCEPSLAACARQIGVGECLCLGKGEALTGGRERDSILSDALEAVIGSIYLDRGTEAARRFIEVNILKQLQDEGLFVDNKSRLQEYIQNSTGGELKYEVIKAEGPDHRKQYTVQVVWDERRLAEGTGSSKKSAEQEAAAKAISLLTQE